MRIQLVVKLMFLTSVATASERPNIICYVADDFGVADSGCYGHAFVKTPNIDRLASEGMRFKRAFAGSPSCAPSRSIFYTGLMSARTGAHPNHWPVNAGTKSIVHFLTEVGYHVAVVNKVHVNPVECFPFETVKASQKQQGGGGSSIDPDMLDAWLAKRLQESPDQPMCLFLCDTNTHLVWPDRQHDGREQIVVPPYIPESDVSRASLARYYTEVELLDARLGECIDVLSKHQLFDDSLFMFTADQGPAFLHGKWNLYDLGIQVPFIARWPKQIKAGSVSDAMISLVDLTPTIVDVAGGTPDQALDGKSFLPALIDPSAKHRERVFATHTGDGTMNNYPCRAIRTERFKLIRNLRPDYTYTTHLTVADGTDRKDVWDAWLKELETNPEHAIPMEAYQRRPEFEFFDLTADSHEIQNLAGSAAHSDVLKKLKQELADWMQSQHDEGQDMAYFLSQKPARKRKK